MQPSAIHNSPAPATRILEEHTFGDITLAGGLPPSASAANTYDVLADIYQKPINIAIFQRQLRPDVIAACQYLIAKHPNFRLALSSSPEDITRELTKALKGASEAEALIQDITELMDVFTCLFELPTLGFRLAVLTRAMCPRFHTDKVPCRLVSTYHGVGSNWLPNSINREKLGAGANGKADHESGLMASPRAIEQLRTGDVALLKGEMWEGNEGNGLVHRSPNVKEGEQRLLLTLDF